MVGFIKIEKGFHVSVAYILYNVSDPVQIMGQNSVYHLGGEKIAKNPSKIFVAGIGKKTSGVGEHTDKSTDQSHIGKCVQLFFHPILLVEEPPAGPKLDFPPDTARIEIANHGSKNLVVGRIKVVNNRFWPVGLFDPRYRENGPVARHA